MRTPYPSRPLALRIALALVALLMVAAMILTGCARSGRDPPADPGAQRTMLSEGYSMLYADATKIDRLELVLYLKFESREFNEVITAISEQGGRLKQDLERLAAEYPGLRIDLVPLPEMERRKRIAIGRDRVLEFMPFAGSSRVDYERTMLIGMTKCAESRKPFVRRHGGRGARSGAQAIPARFGAALRAPVAAGPGPARARALPAGVLAMAGVPR
jgi:hypothetical protein